MITDTRIESLETQVRTLKRMLFGVFGLVVVAGLLAATSLQSVPDVIQAKSFKVMNDEGVPVAILGEYEGWGVLSIHDKKGKPVARLRAANYVPHDGAPEVGGGLLNIFNKDSQSVVHVGVDKDGNGVVETQSGKGQTLVELGATTDGSGMVVTENGKGGTLVILGGNKSEGGLITSYTGKGVTLAALGAGPDGDGVVVTYGKNGEGITSVAPSP